jgi:dephospho-CoA kinase
VPAIGITGGVGTGKSTFLCALLKHAPAESFDADRCVHELLAEDAELLAQIRGAFGDHVFAGDGQLDRIALRAVVFADGTARRALEDLIHPTVRARWVPLARAGRGNRLSLYLDIPLLYETGGEKECDRVVVIACAPTTQRTRLRENRGLAPALIERMI